MLYSPLWKLEKCNNTTTHCKDFIFPLWHSGLNTSHLESNSLVSNPAVSLTSFEILGKTQWSQQSHVSKHMKVAQSCLTFCDPMDRSLPGSSAHGILQAIILDPSPGIKPMSPALQADVLPFVPPGKPSKHTHTLFYCTLFYFTSQILCFFFNKLKVSDNPYQASLLAPISTRVTFVCVCVCLEKAFIWA